jgi:superfamily I DNA/RNA helicase
MTIEETIHKQTEERDSQLNAILSSKAAKKIIVAGAGTGKTYTFKKILENKGKGTNLVLTFIRKLKDEMVESLSDLAEVKTFHSYCKKILHEQNGRVDLVPAVSAIIETDASILNPTLQDFDSKFENLEHSSAEIAFFLARGNYYEAVSFNDSVYRLYRQLEQDLSVIPDFTQLLIDEYQDFNLLEVSFIDLLERKGPILIVGDDDQAVYDKRSASPEYLRAKYKSGNYEKLELTYCSRCTQVIVNATNSLIASGSAFNYLKGRIAKRYECFLGSKLEDSKKYDKIVTANCTKAQGVAAYVKKFIEKIPAEDIAESWIEKKEYPTVLIIGPRQYLKEIGKKLRSDYPQLQYEKKQESKLGHVQAYEELLRNADSNLGWRIIAELFLKRKDLTKTVRESVKGTNYVDLLPPDIVAMNKQILELVKIVKSEEIIPPETVNTLGEMLPLCLY